MGMGADIDMQEKGDRGVHYLRYPSARHIPI